MAYTGILLRGATFSEIVADPPITRELTWAGEFLMGGSNSSTTYILNTPLLAKIGEVDAGTGAFTAQFKTSDIAVLFDGDGYIKDTTNHMLIKGTHEWVYEALAAFDVVDDTTMEFAGITLAVDMLKEITEISATTFEFSGVAIDVEKWAHKTTALATVDSVTADDIAVSWGSGERARVWNETTLAYLGESDTSGGTISFAASQTSGDVLSVHILDADYNKSANTITQIP